MIINTLSYFYSEIKKTFKITYSCFKNSTFNFSQTKNHQFKAIKIKFNV